MRINKSTSHALRIMLACTARESRLTKVAELARDLDLTQQNVFKMIHILSQSGLVVATRGRNGGVKLGRAATDISIGEIVRSIETYARDADGDGGVATYHQSLAPAVAGVLDDALLAFISVLERHSLAEVASLGAHWPATRPKARRKIAKPTIAAGPQSHGSRRGPI